MPLHELAGVCLHFCPGAWRRRSCETGCAWSATRRMPALDGMVLRAWGVSIQGLQGAGARGFKSCGVLTRCKSCGSASHWHRCWWSCLLSFRTSDLMDSKSVGFRGSGGGVGGEAWQSKEGAPPFTALPGFQVKLRSLSCFVQLFPSGDAVIAGSCTEGTPYVKGKTRKARSGLRAGEAAGGWAGQGRLGGGGGGGLGGWGKRI